MVRSAGRCRQVAFSGKRGRSFVVRWKNHCTRSWAACGLLIAATSATWAAQPSEKLLPKTTVGFLAVTNVDRFDEHWHKTQMGQLFNDPVMDQFRKDNRKRMQEHWAATRERYGLTLEDLRTVSGGEVAIAMIEPNPGEAATAVVADTTGHSQQAKAVVAKATATMLQQGAKQSRATWRGSMSPFSSSRLPRRISFLRTPAANRRPPRRLRRAAGPDGLRPDRKPADRLGQRGGDQRHSRPFGTWSQGKPGGSARLRQWS